MARIAKKRKVYIQCPGCGHEHPPQARICPTCGREWGGRSHLAMLQVWRAVRGAKAPSKALLTALIAYADRETGECFPTEATLSEAAGISRTTVFEHLNVLEEAGLIERLPGAYRYAPNTYRVFPRMLPDPPCRGPANGPLKLIEGSGKRTQGSGRRTLRIHRKIQAAAGKRTRTLLSVRTGWF